MENHWFGFLLLTLFCIFAEGFFAMFEMSCVSINKVRLQFYESKKNQRAIWLKYLLDRPSRLFGSTLIVINIALQVGSEASRRFYESIHLSPDLAPLTQVLFVVIFAELAPLFAARRHPEHVAFLTVPVVYVVARILQPFTWLIEKIGIFVNQFFQKTKQPFFYFTKEEIRRAFEEKDSNLAKTEIENVNTIVSNIFMLKNKKAKELMMSLQTVNLFPSSSLVVDITEKITNEAFPFFLIFHDSYQNVVGIVYLSDIIQVPMHSRVVDSAKSIWFVTENTSILQILKQFRFNNQSIALILDNQGKTIGVLTLDQVIDEIFGPGVTLIGQEGFFCSRSKKTVVEKTLAGDMLIKEFNQQFGTNFSFGDSKTLSEMFNFILGHLPSEGEVIYVEQFEFKIEEASLLGAKVISVKTQVI